VTRLADIPQDLVKAGTIPALLPAVTLRNIRAVIFDFDGTLYDYARLPLRIIRAAPWDLPRIWAERRTRKKLAGSDFGAAEAYYDEFFSQMAALCRCPAASARDWFFSRYIPRMIRVLKKYYRLRPGAAELFRLLDSGENPGFGKEPRNLPRGIAVYSDYPCLRERMEALGLVPGERIRLYGPETFGAQKPAPGPFLRIARELGVSPAETLVIGDREDTDGAGALNAGMSFFRLDDGRRRYFRLDPDRAPPKKKDRSFPPLPMGYGSWQVICDMLRACLYSPAP
jgi:FMN phosphatase YigB (HAD superfamily)